MWCEIYSVIVTSHVTKKVSFLLVTMTKMSLFILLRRMGVVVMVVVIVVLTVVGTLVATLVVTELVTIVVTVIVIVVLTVVVTE